MYLNSTLNELSPALNSSGRGFDVVRRAIEQLKARVGIGRKNPEPVRDPLIVALQARLESLEAEVDRLTSLASRERDVAKQEAILAFARDLQRDAHAIREQIRLYNG